MSKRKMDSDSFLQLIQDFKIHKKVNKIYKKYYIFLQIHKFKNLKLYIGIIKIILRMGCVGKIMGT